MEDGIYLINMGWLLDSIEALSITVIVLSLFHKVCYTIPNQLDRIDGKLKNVICLELKSESELDSEEEE